MKVYVSEKDYCQNGFGFNVYCPRFIMHKLCMSM